MYYPNGIEEICYESDHIQQVMLEVRKNLPTYLEKYIQTDGGNSASDEKLAQLAAKFGSTSKPKKKSVNKNEIISRLIKEAVDNFESDREVYQELLHPDSLEEYEMDVSSFKNTVLKNQIPIIRKTLQNISAKELDKYRTAFLSAQPGDLFEVVKNIVDLAEKLRKKWYKSDEFENIENHENLGYHAFDDEKYNAYGVIGGGIKSHFIYKLYPEMFPSRSRESVWAMWYLSGKKHYGCKEDSQFLMINAKDGTTQQNYFYPYGLFSFYALEIYRMLKDYYRANDVQIADIHRFIVVEAFLSFIARQHQNETDVLKQKADNYNYEY